MGKLFQCDRVCRRIMQGRLRQREREKSAGRGMNCPALATATSRNIRTYQHVGAGTAIASVVGRRFAAQVAALQ
ncbi:MAG: hypothetical protein E6833_35670, partial [Bradyrhizobium sp.]|nr:hypothetical protein [Bradyrhizobium sp.]